MRRTGHSLSPKYLIFGMYVNHDIENLNYLRFYGGELLLAPRIPFNIHKSKIITILKIQTMHVLSTVIKTLHTKNYVFRKYNKIGSDQTLKT